ncbi:MAG TPA: phosphatidate cytidylyltransferase [Paludibacteraceae bacterium]|nr:phosphatidate cytidylyltransferase [Paludibacteraceae bacterium]
MNNFVKRSISGGIFVTIIVCSVLLSPYTFAVIFTVFAALGVHEFHKLTNSTETAVNKTVAIIGAVLLFTCSFIYASGKYQYPIFSFYGFYILAVLIAELYRKKRNPVNNWAYFILGQILIALPFSLLSFILYIRDYQPIILLAVFISIWVNDTGAYVTGMLLGKHKLFERISPKKTWEGFIGGAVFALLSGYIFSLLIPELSLIQWLIFSEIVVIFGTFGDLSESLLKRTEQVKDSGNIIPGHGGLLDRFDSMLMAAPVIFIWLSFIL